MKVKKLCELLPTGQIINVYVDGDLVGQGFPMRIEHDYGEKKIKHIDTGLMYNGKDKPEYASIGIIL